MKILKPLHFCLTSEGHLGIAEEGSFAASAWTVSDEFYRGTSGSKFTWIAPNGKSYVDDRNLFSRPTVYQIEQLISEELKLIAIENGLIEL